MALPEASVADATVSFDDVGQQACVPGIVDGQFTACAHRVSCQSETHAPLARQASVLATPLSAEQAAAQTLQLVNFMVATGNAECGTAADCVAANQFEGTCALAIDGCNRHLGWSAEFLMPPLRWTIGSYVDGVHDDKCYADTPCQMVNGSIWFEWDVREVAGGIPKLVSVLRYDVSLPSRPGISEEALRASFSATLNSASCMAPYQQGVVLNGPYAPIVLDLVTTNQQAEAARCIAQLIAHYSSWPNEIYSVDDADGDGWGPVCDCCPNDANGDCSDEDADGLPACEDNCPNDRNPDQADADGDGIGDACECDAILTRHPTCTVDTSQPGYNRVLSGTELPHPGYSDWLMGETRCEPRNDGPRYDLTCHDAVTFQRFVERRVQAAVAQSGWPVPKSSVIDHLEPVYEDEVIGQLPSSLVASDDEEEDAGDAAETTEAAEAGLPPGVEEQHQGQAAETPAQRPKKVGARKGQRSRQRGRDFELHMTDLLIRGCGRANVFPQLRYQPMDDLDVHVRIRSNIKDPNSKDPIVDIVRQRDLEAQRRPGLIVENGGIRVQRPAAARRWRRSDAVVVNCGGTVPLTMSSFRHEKRYIPGRGAAVMYEFKCLNPFVQFSGRELWAILMQVGFAGQMKDYIKYVQYVAQEGTSPAFHGRDVTLVMQYFFCGVQNDLLGMPQWARLLMSDVLDNERISIGQFDAFCVNTIGSDGNTPSECEVELGRMDPTWTRVPLFYPHRAWEMIANNPTASREFARTPLGRSNCEDRIDDPSEDWSGPPDACSFDMEDIDEDYPFTILDWLSELYCTLGGSE